MVEQRVVANAHSLQDVFCHVIAHPFPHAAPLAPLEVFYAVLVWLALRASSEKPQRSLPRMKTHRVCTRLEQEQRCSVINAPHALRRLAFPLDAHDTASAC